MANRPGSKPVVHTKKHQARLERERVQTRLILFSFIGILVVAIGLVVYGYLDEHYFQARRPVAKVAGVGIAVSYWQARVRMERTRLINQMTLYEQYSQYFGMDLTSQIQQFQSQLSDPTTLGQTVLNQMIDEELIRQEAAKRGITASPKEIEDAIQASYQYYPNGSPTPTITPTAVSSPTYSAETLRLVTLTPTLSPQSLTATAVAELTPSPSPSPVVTASPAATGSPAVTGSPVATGSPASTGSPVPTLTATSAATATQTATATSAATSTPAATATPLPTSTPYTLEGFQTAYKTGVDKIKALGMTEDEIRSLYASEILRQKLFDIITADVPNAQEEVWARHILVKDEATAQAVRQRLMNGEDFAKVAAETSTDTSNKDKGGDLGWFGKGAMVPEFQDAAFALKVGEISQPVKTTYGYHIIQVLAHANIPMDASTYEQAKQTAFNDWLKKLRDQYKVETFNNWQNLVPTDPAAPAAPQ